MTIIRIAAIINMGGMTMKFTVTIHNNKAINKLKSLGRKKGKYISELIEKDIKVEELENRIEKLEKRQ